MLLSRSTVFKPNLLCRNENFFGALQGDSLAGYTLPLVWLCHFAWAPPGYRPFESHRSDMLMQSH